MTESMHPNNHRVGVEGIGDAIMEYLNYYVFPPVYVTKRGTHQHESPLCPHVKGRTHYAMCREDALYIYGEKWCSRCATLESKDRYTI